MARATKADLASFTRNVEARLKEQEKSTKELMEEYHKTTTALNKKLEELEKREAKAK